MIKISENKKLDSLCKYGFTIYEDLKGILLSCEQDFETKYTIINIQIDKKDRIVQIKEFPKSPSQGRMYGQEMFVKMMIRLNDDGYLIYD